MGVPHPDFIDRILTGRQWQDWLNFDSLEMIGNEQYREELRHGQKMAQYANYHRDVKTCPDGYPPIDFMNFTERVEVKPVELSPEETQVWMDKQVFGI